MGHLEQIGVEVLTEGPIVTDSRVHAIGLEVMSASPSPARLYAFGIEVMSSTPGGGGGGGSGDVTGVGVGLKRIGV